MRPGRFHGAEDGVTAVVGVVLAIVIAIVVSVGVFFIVQEITAGSGKSAPAVGLVTDSSGSGGNAWTIRVQAVNRESLIPDYLLIVRTPENGTLVARPVGDTGSDSFYWPLTAASGKGTQAAVDAPGTTGGFHLRYEDTDANVKFNAGDRLALYYDGNGDQGHVSGADDTLPLGTYVFELKHVGTDAMVASISRG